MKSQKFPHFFQTGPVLGKKFLQDFVPIIFVFTDPEIFLSDEFDANEASFEF